MMAAVIVDASAAGSVRHVLRDSARGFKKGTLHFNELLPKERTAALKVFDELDIVSSWVVVHARTKGQRDMDSRDLILEELVRRCQQAQIATMVLDNMVGRQPKDAEVIRRARTGGANLNYNHAFSKDEPLLWLADGTVHTYGRNENPLPRWHSETIKLL